MEPLIGTILVPAMIELIKNGAVALTNSLKDRGKRDKEAKEEALRTLEDVTATIQSRIEQITETPLPKDAKDILRTTLDSAILKLPIGKAAAEATMARLLEIPRYRLQTVIEQADWGIAVNHYWLEKLFKHRFDDLGYTLGATRELTEGAVGLWLDVDGSKFAPRHRAIANFVCTEPTDDHQVAAVLYDMESSGILQEGDWFFLATQHVFSDFSQSSIAKAKSRVPYIIIPFNGSDIKSVFVDATSKSDLGRRLQRKLRSLT